MSFLIHLFLVVHLLAFAGLFGSLLGQLASPPWRVTEVTAWSARTIFLAGLVLVGLLQADDRDVDNAKIGVKLIVALIVVALVEANRKKRALLPNVYALILGLTAVNVLIAVFWT